MTNATFSLKKIIPIIVGIITLIGGFFFIEDRYISSEELGAFEFQVVQTLKAYQEKTNLRLDLRLHEELLSQIQSYKRRIRENPNDQELKEELREIKKYAADVKRRIDKALMKYRPQ